MTRPSREVAVEFHRRVLAACRDDLTSALAQLHRPHIVDTEPVCRGCDRERPGGGDDDPLWPCRTYTLIAANVLDQPNVEAILARMRR
jgi:hypothetical protein